MTGRSRARSSLAVPVGLAIGSLALYVAIVATPLLDALEFRAGDPLFRWRQAIAPPAPPSDIVIVAIDDVSMQEVGLPWPWPRAVHAELVDALVANGAAVIGFDVLFLEPTDPLHDRRLATALRDAGNVVLAEAYHVGGDAGQRREQWLRPIEPLLEAAAGTGLADVVADTDGSVRRAYMETPSRISPHPLPAFAVALVDHWRQRNGAEPTGTGRPIPGPLLANFLGPPRTVPTVSYYQALDPDTFLPRGTFDRKMVLVGRSFAGVVDFDTPDHFGHPFRGRARGAMAGVEVHATLADTLMRERILRPAPAWLHGAAFVLALGLAGTALRWLPGYGALMAVAGIAISVVAVALVAFVAAGVVSPYLAALVGLGAFVGLERAHKIVVVDREKRFIQKAFRHYVAPAVVDRLIDDPELLQLGGERYDATVLFTDLVGFTRLSEGMQPTELREFLTGYFTEMTDILLAHDGTLDKFIGDAILGCFGVPVPHPDHPYQAARAAWDMQRRLDELNRDWQAEGLPRLAMRIGVNTGPVTAGNIGTRTLFNYTVMGDTVNLGARLESANKFYGTAVLVGESTRARLAGRLVTRPVDRIRVQGKQEPIVVYELLGPPEAAGERGIAAAERHARAFERYQARDFEAALPLLESAAGDDRPAQLLRERCLGYRAAPPGDDWDGVFAMEGK